MRQRAGKGLGAVVGRLTLRAPLGVGGNEGPQVRRDAETYVVGLVNSPLQCVNFLEACSTLNMSPDLVLLARESWSERSIPQAVAVLQQLNAGPGALPYDVGNYVLSLLQLRPARRAMKRAVSLIETGRRDKPITLVIGNYPHAFWWALANRLRALDVKVVVVDDGIGSLQIDRSANAKSQWTDVLKKTLFRVLGFDERPRFPITFCSTYAMSERLSARDQLVPNERPLLRALAGEVIQESPFSLVLGTPVTDAADSGLIVDDDIELALRQLRFAARSHRDLEAVYVPHHKERQEKLDAIGKEFRVAEARLPIEIAVLLSGRIPSHLIGLPSTAYKNLLELFPGRVHVDLLELPDHMVSDRVRDVYRSLYEYHRRGFPDEISIVPADDWLAVEQFPPGDRR